MSDLNLLICFIFFQVQTFKCLLLKNGGKTHCVEVLVHIYTFKPVTI